MTCIQPLKYMMQSLCEACYLPFSNIIFGNGFYFMVLSVLCMAVLRKGERLNFLPKVFFVLDDSSTFQEWPTCFSRSLVTSLTCSRSVSVAGFYLLPLVHPTVGLKTMNIFTWEQELMSLMRCATQSQGFFLASLPYLGSERLKGTSQCWCCWS